MKIIDGKPEYRGAVVRFFLVVVWDTYLPHYLTLRRTGVGWMVVSLIMASIGNHLIYQGGRYWFHMS